MFPMKRWVVPFVPLVAGLLLWSAAMAQDGPATAGSPKLTCEQMEELLREGKMGSMRNIPKGVTLPKRTTLTDGKITHDASIQVIHESKNSFASSRGTELNFKDWWEFNVAGYELAKLLQLNMVPPYVARKVGGQSASVSWWIDNAMMEVERVKNNKQPPDLDTWNKEMYVLRVFNQLIYNVDDNLTNVLISPDWHIWMIDFTRSFRSQKNILNVKNLVQCDKKLLENLRKLSPQDVEEKLVRAKYVNKMEADALLARRDKIVKFFDDEVAKKGAAAVLFDLPRVAQPCGTGL